MEQPGLIGVYGYSDDLLEIDGDFTDEFDLLEQVQAHLETYLEIDVNGERAAVILGVRYNKEGIWRIRAVKGADKVKIRRADVALQSDTERPPTGAFGEPEYSDLAIVAYATGARLRPHSMS